MINKYISALQIIQRLKDNGHEAYFVGGWVRDKLLGINNEESDIDIATSASVQDIPKIFSDCVFVGQAFGVCLVKVKSEKGYYQFDLATFRVDGVYEDGRRPSAIKTKSVSAEADAKRRDFTINALFYDPIKNKVIDYVGGQKDLNDGIIRAVDEPIKRFKEDKLRMIRAVRLLYQINGKLFANLVSGLIPTKKKVFIIEEKTKQAIKDLSNKLIPAVSFERIWQELDKASKLPNFYDFFYKLDELGLLAQFLPETKKWNGIWWESCEDVLEALPQNTPTLIKIMAILGTFDKEKVLQITQRFNIKKPNWVE